MPVLLVLLLLVAPVTLAQDPDPADAQAKTAIPPGSETPATARVTATPKADPAGPERVPGSAADGGPETALPPTPEFGPEDAFPEEPAGFPKEWHLTGNTTSRAEQYGVRGSGGTPFGNTGSQYYQELSFSTLREISPYDKWQVEFGGLWNNSLYRSQDWGFVTERFRIYREKGDAFMPYRYELGDFYGNFSYRTLQRSLKGLQLELQSRPAGTDRESFVLVLGQSDPDWRNLHKDRDRTAGISWLLQREGDLKLSVNWVFAHRDADPVVGTLERRQSVGGVALEKEGRLFGRRSLVEGELAFFRGDHDGTTGPATGQGKNGRGVFAQVSGGDNPFVYRLRYEANTQDFRPYGGNVAPDRRSMESFLTWNLQGGRNAMLRFQYFKDAWETVNPRTTHLAGIGLRGPIDERHRLHGGIDAYVEAQDDRADTLDTDLRSLVADVSKTFSDRLSGRLSWSYRDLDDNVTDLGDNRVSQLTLGLDHTIRVARATGRVSLNLDHRLNDQGGFHSREWTPALAVNLARGGHDFGLYYRFQDQDERDPTRIDVETRDGSLRYQYHWGNQTLGVEYLANRRTDSAGVWSRSYQVNAFYGYDFDTDIRSRRVRPAVPAKDGQYPLRARDGAFGAGEVAPGVATASLGDDPLAGLRLNGAFAEAVDALTARVGAPSRRTGNLGVFETTYFDDVAYRQRLVVVEEAERLARASLVIDVNTEVSGQIMDTFERVRRELIRRFGPPANLHERGDVGPDLADDVRNGAFVRNYDWHLPAGVLRFGLPKRLDGRVILEVALRESFPSPRENSWGLELLE